MRATASSSTQRARSRPEVGRRVRADTGSPTRIQHFLGRMGLLPAGVMSLNPQTAHQDDRHLAHLGDEREPPWTSTGWSSVRTRLRLREDRDVLAALQGVLRGPEHANVPGAAVDRDAAGDAGNAQRAIAMESNSDLPPLASRACPKPRYG